MQTETLVQKDRFKQLLDEFNELTKDLPPLEKIKNRILEIAENAKGSTTMNSRQSDAIYQRCQNYLNGTYGKNLSKLK